MTRHSPSTQRAPLWRAALLAALAMLTFALVPARAQGGFTAAQRAEIVQIVREALRQDPTILRDAITALQDDESARKDAAARAAIGGLGPVLTRTPGDPQAGNPKGDVTVVEFYDVRCPYCRRMVPVMAELLKRDANIRVVYKDIPILGPASVLGAKAMLAALNQGGYQRLYDILMTGNPNIDMAVLEDAARRAGLDWPRLRRDMDSKPVQARIDANLALAHRLGIQGTPAYVIGNQLLPGAVELADLQGAVAAARRD
ncbi:MAG: hypothetical protein ABS99_08370 [Acetobacteraceae bacterium SCN 69-10]|mgnify:CR=1 FL=1|nr:DsbA family protein [Rhodospirillales bacterium]ODU54952.1 MAG: hypothetical protein ABS99_08370 [Acetobacteraceae bacterium SCN 69-10]OJY70981.1 MAG: hypothetical protein BGP12_07740 [Rhodospirillales bacterium 70-18]